MRCRALQNPHICRLFYLKKTIAFTVLVNLDFEFAQLVICLDTLKLRTLLIFFNSYLNYCLTHCFEFYDFFINLSPLFNIWGNIFHELCVKRRKLHPIKLHPHTPTYLYGVPQSWTPLYTKKNTQTI